MPDPKSLIRTARDVVGPVEQYKKNADHRGFLEDSERREAASGGIEERLGAARESPTEAG